MIKTFRCPDTAALFGGQCPARMVNIASVAQRKLQMLHRATGLADLRIPPNNRLQALKGERQGQHSIRINDQWRICFVWHSGQASEVEIVDYH